MNILDTIDKWLPVMEPIGIVKAFNNCLTISNGDGLFLEFGVANGGSLKVLSDLAPHLTFHGFDSFEGMPEAWNGFPVGQFKVELPEPLNSQTEFTIFGGRIVIHVGLFNYSLPIFVKEYKELISFINIDCDLYTSTKAIFNNLKSQIKCDTVLRFDEIYNYPDWKDHEYKAFYEFLEETGLDAIPICRAHPADMAFKLCQRPSYHKAS